MLVLYMYVKKKKQELRSKNKIAKKKIKLGGHVRRGEHLTFSNYLMLLLACHMYFANSIVSHQK